MGWIRLNKIGLKEPYIRKLMDMYSSYEELYLENNFKLFNDELKKKLEKAKKLDLSEFLEEHKRHNIQIIDAKSKEYPKILKQIIDYPLFLYVKSKKTLKKTYTNSKSQRDRRNIAVVGTRKMSKYGKSACEKIVKELLEYDITLISGLAEGIDTLALNTAIEKGKKTIAVIGTGLDIIYPRENRYLWEKIYESGSIISEYPLGAEPTKWSFPRRNRIIAGLSDGILIGESYKKGGSLITAELGILLNKEIFAIPGFINYPSFEGCNNLIKENKAKLVTCGDDIAKEFLWDVNTYKNKKIELEENEKIVFDILYEEMSIEEIKKEIEKLEYNTFTINDILIILMKLKIKGLITETGNAKYMRLV